MDKNISKQFAVNVWDKMNLFLFVSTILSTIVFLVLFVWCFHCQLGSPTQSLILGMCGVFASLASAFFIAWIIRYFDLKKKQEQELKALEIISPYLSKIFSTIETFFPQLKCFATINTDDTINYPQDIVYYTDLSVSQENRSFVDLNTEFKSAYAQLNQDLTECLNAPIIYQCNDEIIKLFTGLKLNQLTYKLFEIFKASVNPFFSGSAFMELHKSYEEFDGYYQTLSKLVTIKPTGTLAELSDSEKDLYIKEIETIKKQLPSGHSGKIYRGRVRIQ